MPVYEGDLDKIRLDRQHERIRASTVQFEGRHRSGRCDLPADISRPGGIGRQLALRLLKKSRKPMALVRDAEGKIRGMITLEDVLKEIVGDIEDEHDRPMQKIRPRRRVPTKRAEIKRPV